jgi:hypothetical protein
MANINNIDPRLQQQQVNQPGLSVRELQQLTEQVYRQAETKEVIQQKTLSSIIQQEAQTRGTTIVSNAVASFAKSTLGSIFKESKVTDRDDVSEQKNVQSDSGEEDSAVIKQTSKGTRLREEIKLKTKYQEENKQSVKEQDSETQALIKEYTTQYGQLISSRSGVATEELKKIENKLRAQGYSNDQLFQLKLSIKNGMRGALMSQIKEAFLKRTVSMDMVVELGTAERGLNELFGEIMNSPELGGTEFGGYLDGLQGTANAAAEEVCRDVRIALQEIMNQKMTERLVSTTVDPEMARKELKGLLQIGNRVGFSSEEYLKTWQKEKIDQGLFIFNRPDLAVNLSSQMNQQKQHEQEDAETSEDEQKTEDYLINRLRALYIRSAIKDNWRTSLDTQFKIIKTKNSMIKLGIFSQDVNDKVKKESQLIAAGKTLEMLRETFMERATLYKLSGPAFQLIEAKQVGLMKNAEKLGMDIGEYEFNLIRDRSNQAVFEVAKRELQLTTLSIQVKDTPVMQDKKKKLVQLLKRLKAESGLTDDLGIPESELRDRVKIEGV